MPPADSAALLRTTTSRRQLLRGGAVVAGAVWVAPAVQVIGLTAADASVSSGAPGSGDLAVSTPIAPRFLSAVAGNNSGTATVTMTEPVLASSVDKSDFIIRFNFANNSGHRDQEPAVVVTGPSTFTVSWPGFPGDYYQRYNGTFQILASASNDVVDLQGTRQPTTDIIDVVIVGP